MVTTVPESDGMTADPVHHPVEAYFAAMRSALKGLRIYLAHDDSPLYGHGIVGQVVAGYVNRLEASFSAWENRVAFMERFRINRAESGYPVFQSVLELQNDRETAEERLASIPDPDAIKAEMADFILRHKAFPDKLQTQMAERLYLEGVLGGEPFGPFVLPGW